MTLPARLSSAAKISPEQAEAVLTALRTDDRLLADVMGAVAWRPIETAPKDGTPCLILTKHPIGYLHGEMPEGLHPLWARAVVAYNEDHNPHGYTTDWSLAGPFGRGVGTDDFIEGWQPLPEPSAPGGE